MSEDRLGWGAERVKDYFDLFCMVGEKWGFAGENEGKRMNLDGVRIRKRGDNKATLNDSRRQARVTGTESWKTSVGKGESSLLCGAKLGRNCKRFATEQGDVDEQG